MAPRAFRGVVEKLGVGYIRVSDVGDRGDELISPELQEFAIRSFADAEGIQIVRWIYDLDKSGRTFTKRSVGEVIEGIRDGHWKFVVLWKWSRWGRNMRESQIHLGLVEEAGGIVRAATEDFDPNTTMGRFTRDQMLLIAQLQSDMISDGWKEVQAKRRRDGLPHTGSPRFGYTYSAADGYQPDPDTAPILVAAYERYVAGEAHRKLTAEFNAAGLRTTRGGRFGPYALSRVMDTGFAAGLIRERSNPPGANASGGPNGRSIWCFDVWRKGVHEPLISMELWEVYKARRDAQALMAPRLRTAPHALSGLLRCGWSGCGGPMVAVYSGQYKRHSWVCSRARDMKIHKFNSVSNARAMADILAWVEANAMAGEDVTGKARRLAAARQAKGEVEAHDAEIARLLAKRSRLVDLYTDGAVDRGDYLDKKAEIDESLMVVTEERDAAQAREKVSPADLVREFSTLASEWPRFEPADMREALSRVVARVEVREGPYMPGKVRPVPVWEA